MFFCRGARPQLLLAACLAAASLCSASGCAVGPDFHRPVLSLPERYTQEALPGQTVPADGTAQQFQAGAKVAAEWWRLFNSPSLDALIQDAVANNQNLQAAQASLRQSQENLHAGYGVFFPQFDAGFDAARQKFSQSRFGGSSTSSIFNLFTLSASVSYALDIFGGERRTVESLQAQVAVQQFTVLGTYLALTGNIVNTAIAGAAYREQIKATQQTIDMQKEQIKITEAQVKAGTVPYSNVLSLRAQVALVEATLPPLKQKLSQADHLLAALTGRMPAAYTAPGLGLADLRLPATLPVTLPSDLVRQRPDILAAEAQLRSASAEIGVATAAMFPSFALSGGYGRESTVAKDLFRSDSGIWNLGANLTAPLFHGGTLSSKRKAAIQGYEQSLALYRQTVLSGFAQVADILRALEHDAETVQAQSQALEATGEALRMIQANYQAGTASYVQVLLADIQLQQAKIGYLQAVAQRYQDTTALFVALGGGWWNGQKEP